MRAPSSSRIESVMFSAMKAEDVIRDLDRLRFGLPTQNREAGLEIRTLNIGDETPLEPAAQTVLECGNCIRGAVRGEHDLLVVLMQFVERVEEFLLEAFLSFEELDVINQEDVIASITSLELRLSIGANRLDELVQEGLCGDVANPVGRVVIGYIVGKYREEGGFSPTLSDRG